MSVRNIKRCCVKNCEDTVSPRHRFPKNYKSVMQEWIEKVNHPRFSSITVEQIYKSYMVCGRYFSSDCLVPGTKRGLTVNAVPTLHLGNGDKEPVIPLQVQDETPLEVQSLAAQEPCVSQSTMMNIEHLDVHTTHSDIGSVLVNKNTEAQSVLPTTPQKQDPRVFEIVSGATRTKSKRKSLLSEVHVSRQTDLTPKARHFYKRYAEYGAKLASVHRRQKNFKKRLQAAVKFSKTSHFHNIIESVNQQTYNFIMSQIRTQPLPPRCRRYTLRDKIFALSLYKVSPKGYRFLQKVFALPSRNTVLGLLSRIEMTPGINQAFFKTLESSVKKMKLKERYCIILYDELHLSPNVTFNRKTDSITGVEDCGTRKPKICNYATVFMVKGIFKLWKQPVAFNFSAGPIASGQLKVALTEIIKECQSIGLHVVGTICDQATNNEATVNALKKETEEECKKQGIENRYFGFLINNEEIIPFYDVPHLFKGLRNNLLSKNLHFEMEDGIKKVAKWEHIVQFYYLDSAEETRICPKLTDSHVIEEKMKKMKVSYCTQTFSHQVGSLMKRIAQWNIPGLDPKAVETAELILFLDKLFDSLNGSTLYSQESKPLKGGVRKDSPHEEFWHKAITCMSKWKFYSPSKKCFVSVPSLKNIIYTIRAFQYVRKLLFSDGFTYFLPRVFNQDAIENFFGAVRNHGGTNCNPNAAHFIASVKTLLINNIFSHHSPSSNCEEDVTTGALNTLNSFISKEHITIPKPVPDETYNFEKLPKDLLIKKMGRVESCTITYVAGYVASKMKKYADNCEICKKNIFYRSSTKDLDFIIARTYRKSKLTTPGEYFTYVVGRCLGHIFYVLPRACHMLGITELLNCVLRRNSIFSPITCTSHPQMIDSFIQHMVVCAVHFWCRQVNLILSGNGNKFSKFLLGKPNTKVIDPIKLQAWNMYVKKSQKRKKGRLF